jgi:transposase
LAWIWQSVFSSCTVLRWTGEVKFRKKLTRDQFRAFMAAQKPVPLAIVFEACGSASYWAREIAAFGHEVKLIAPQLCEAVRQAAEE